MGNIQSHCNLKINVLANRFGTQCILSCPQYKWMIICTEQDVTCESTNLLTGDRTLSSFNRSPNGDEFEIGEFGHVYCRVIVNENRFILRDSNGQNVVTVEIDNYDVTDQVNAVLTSVEQALMTTITAVPLIISHSRELDAGSEEEYVEYMLADSNDEYQEWEIDTGLTKEEVEQLPKANVQTKEQEFVCGVCQEAAIQGHWFRFLPCGHKYHVECIDPWMIKRGTCPECRLDVTLQDVNTMD